MSIPAAIQKGLDATKVEYVNLGTSGLRVSLPILGCMGFGSKQWGPWVLDEAESIEILQAAYDRGINTWDTADMYSNGISEEVLGKAIRKLEIPREKLVLMTKCYLPVEDNASFFVPQVSQSRDYVNRMGEFRRSAAPLPSPKIC